MPRFANYGILSVDKQENIQIKYSNNVAITQTHFKM